MTRILPFTLILITLTLTSNWINGQELPPVRTVSKKHVHLLTIGNSFTRNATRYLADLAKASGIRLTHRAISVGGASLQLHAEKALVYEREPSDPNGLYANGRSLQQELANDTWDYVTIQQASIKSHNIETFRPFASQLQSIVSQYASNAELLIHQTWAYRVDDPRFSIRSNDLGEPKTQAAMYKELSIAYATIAEELGIRRIPVGDAFFQADTEPRFGFRPDPLFDVKQAKYPVLPNQDKSLHVGWRWQVQQTQPQKWGLRIDGHHANAAGEYLGSCVWYEVLFEESCIGNTFMPEGIDVHYAIFLQVFAHRAAVTASKARATAPIFPK